MKFVRTRRIDEHQFRLLFDPGEEAPEDWRGALNITYRLGPGFTENKITVSVEINNYYKVKSIFDVIGTIYGDVEPDRYALIGNHRDAWVYGGVDPSSATAVVTEIARVLGGLKKAGWKPRRTIKVNDFMVKVKSCLVRKLTAWTAVPQHDGLARSVSFPTLLDGKLVHNVTFTLISFFLYLFCSCADMNYHR